MEYIYKFSLAILLFIGCFATIDGQQRVSFSIDHSGGYTLNDLYYSLPEENIINGVIPSFTITKHIKQNQAMSVQMLVRYRSKDVLQSESLALLFQKRYLSKGVYKFDYQIGLHFHIGGQKLVDIYHKPSIYANVKATTKFKPSLAFGISRDFDFAKRYFFRCQALGLGKLTYINKQVGYGGAIILNLGLGIRFGKTDRAFPKQDEINDL